MALVLHIGTMRLSSWSLRAYLACAQSGLPFDTRTIRLDTAATRDEIAKVTPAGKVPVLHHDDLVIWDSLAICEYVNELAPGAQLWPAESRARARARTISAEMHAGFAALRRDMPMDLLAAKPGVGHTPEALADAARVQHIWRDALAASGGPYLFGAFTIADAMFAPVTTRFTTYGVPLDEAARSYVGAVAGHPAMRRWRDGARVEAGQVAPSSPA